MGRFLLLMLLLTSQSSGQCLETVLPVERTVILGSRGWLASHLVSALSEKNFLLFGTYRSVPPNLDLHLEKISELESYLNFLEQVRPKIIVNLLRGESEVDFDLHQRLIEYSKQNNIYYVFVSSAAALDGNRIWYEHETANALTGYGGFKASVERVLRENYSNSAIIRFGAMQGWASNKTTRTELFLKKLEKGIEARVTTQITNGRLSENAVAQMISEIVSRRATGTFHLGTTDEVSNLTFSRSLAREFGYSPFQVVPKEEHSPFVQHGFHPERIMRFGTEFNYSWEDTVDYLGGVPELQKYRKQN